MDSLLEWLQTSMPGMLESSVTWLKDKAMGLPSFGLALIIYIMASYLLTADYPYLRSQAARHTHQRLLNFSPSAGCGGGRLRRLSEGGISLVRGGVFHPAGRLFPHRPALRPAAGPGPCGDGLYPHHRRGHGDGAWAFVCLFTGDFATAFELMLIWGIIALFRRVMEPKFVGDQTGLSPILSLVSIYVGMKLAGVLGMILGPTVALIALNLAKLGLFDGVRRDITAAADDVMALLRERPDQP